VREVSRYDSGAGRSHVRTNRFPDAVSRPDVRRGAHHAPRGRARRVGPPHARWPQIAVLKPPRWETAVDIGPLVPGELVATGFDEQGNEIARASQILNLPRPTAEFDIVLESDAKGPTVAALRWRHIMKVKPKSATISVDGSPLSVAPDFRAALPRLDPVVPHIVAAEMRFEDDFVARRELVIEGSRSDSIGTQLADAAAARFP
jgi:hypothetical protein